jgi:hypothetical protein
MTDGDRTARSAQRVLNERTNVLARCAQLTDLVTVRAGEAALGLTEQF